MRALRALVLVLFTVAAPAHAQENGLDRSTPRRAVRSFVLTSRNGNYETAARVLDLSAIPEGERREQGPRLARELKVVLDQELWLDFARVPDRAEVGTQTIGTLTIDGNPIPIELVRSGDTWLFSQATVASIPALYDEHGAPWIASKLPDWLSRVRFWEMELWQWIGLLIALLLGYLAGVIVGFLLLKIGGRFVARTKTDWDDRLLELSRAPTRALLTVLLAWVLIEALILAAPAQEIVNKTLSVALVASLGWYGLRLVRFAAERIIARAEKRKEVYDELSMRGLRTQVAVLRRVFSIVVGIIMVASMLMQFDEVRTVGTSLLTSAGIAGIVLGLAAQRSIATLLANLQLSITRPVRINDTVQIENEQGVVEEINLTFVVVKLWDTRRLIVPTNKFLESSFQNHTKVLSNEQLGHVILHADYELPIERVRKEFERILESSTTWDKKQKELVVTDATDRTIQLRALVSASDAKNLWELRCEVRERLISFINGLEGGRFLPRTRIEPEDGGDEVVA